MLAAALFILATPPLKTSGAEGRIAVLGEVVVRDCPNNFDEKGLVVEPVRDGAQNSFKGSKLSKGRYLVFLPASEQYRVDLVDPSGRVKQTSVNFKVDGPSNGEEWIEAPRQIVTKYLGGTQANALPQQVQITLRIDDLVPMAEDVGKAGLTPILYEIEDLKVAVQQFPELQARLETETSKVITLLTANGEVEPERLMGILKPIQVAVAPDPPSPEEAKKLEEIVKDPDQYLPIRCSALRRLGSVLVDDSEMGNLTKQLLASGSELAFPAADALAKSKSPALRNFLIEQMKAPNLDRAIPAIYAACEADIPGSAEALFSRIDLKANPEEQVRLVGVMADLPGLKFKNKLIQYMGDTSNPSISKTAKRGLSDRNDISEFDKSRYRIDIFRDLSNIDLTKPNPPATLSEQLKEFFKKLNQNDSALERLKGGAGSGLGRGGN